MTFYKIILLFIAICFVHPIDADIYDIIVSNKLLINNQNKFVTSEVENKLKSMLPNGTNKERIVNYVSSVVSSSEFAKFSELDDKLSVYFIFKENGSTFEYYITFIFIEEKLSNIFVSKGYTVSQDQIINTIRKIVE